MRAATTSYADGLYKWVPSTSANVRAATIGAKLSIKDIVPSTSANVRAATSLSPSIRAASLPSTSANVRAATDAQGSIPQYAIPSTSANVRAATDSKTGWHGLLNLQPVPTCELQHTVSDIAFISKPFNQCQRASCNGKNAQNTDHARIIVCILTFSSARPSSKMKKNGCYLDLGTGRRPDRR